MAAFLLFGRNDRSQSSISVNKQQITNSFISETDDYCINWEESSASDNTVIVIGGEKETNTTIQATGTVDATCVINQEVVASTAQMVKSQTKQKQSQANGLMSFFNGASSNAAVNVQGVYNNISSTSRAFCGTTALNVADNNTIVYYQKTGGDIVISADSDLTSSCVTSNLISQMSYNSMSSAFDLNSSQRSGFTSIVLVIGIVIIFIAIVGVVGVVSISGVKKVEASKPVDPTVQQLEEIEKLGV